MRKQTEKESENKKRKRKKRSAKQNINQREERSERNRKEEGRIGLILPRGQRMHVRRHMTARKYACEVKDQRPMVFTIHPVSGTWVNDAANDLQTRLWSSKVLQVASS